MPNKAPWSDIRLRQAINLVFDRRQAIDLTEEGVGHVGSYLATRYGGLSAEETAKLPGFRPDKDQDIKDAKRLMSEAGFGGGLSFPVMYRNVAAYQDVALAYAGQLDKALGIKMTPDLPADDAVWKDRETNCLHNGFFHRAVTGQDPEDQLNAHVSAAGYYRTKCGWDLPEVDKLYAEQAITPDPQKRKQLLQQMDQLLLKELPFIQLHYSGYWASSWPFVNDSGLGVAPDIRSDQWHIDTWLDK